MIIVEARGKEVGVTVGVTEVVQAVDENFARVENSQSSAIVYKLAERNVILLDSEKVLAEPAA